MSTLPALLLALGSLGLAAPAAAAERTPHPLDTVAELQAGHERYRDGSILHERLGGRRALVLAPAQLPEEAEALFDRPPGELAHLTYGGARSDEALMQLVEARVADLPPVLLVIGPVTPDGAGEAPWKAMEGLLRSCAGLRDRVARGEITLLGLRWKDQDGRGELEWSGLHPNESALLAGRRAPRPRFNEPVWTELDERWEAAREARPSVSLLGSTQGAGGLVLLAAGLLILGTWRRETGTLLLGPFLGAALWVLWPPAAPAALMLAVAVSVQALRQRNASEELPQAEAPDEALAPGVAFTMPTGDSDADRAIRLHRSAHEVLSILDGASEALTRIHRDAVDSRTGPAPGTRDADTAVASRASTDTQAERDPEPSEGEKVARALRALEALTREFRPRS